MADPAQHPRMTADQFLAWDDGTDTRYELADGEVRAMAAPAEPHQTILGNLVREFSNRLRSRPPCRVRVEVALQVRGDTVWQTDAAIFCTLPGELSLEPLLLIEVQSPSTRATDLGRKLEDYKEIPSVQEIWMVDSSRRRIQVWHRVEQEWLGRDHIARGEYQSQTVGGDPLTLDLIYEHCGL